MIIYEYVCIHIYMHACMHVSYNTTIQYNTIQYITTQYNAIQHNAIQYNIVNTVLYNTIPYNNVPYNTIQHNILSSSSWSSVYLFQSFVFGEVSKCVSHQRPQRQGNLARARRIQGCLFGRMTTRGGWGVVFSAFAFEQPCVLLHQTIRRMRA